MSEQSEKIEQNGTAPEKETTGDLMFTAEDMAAAEDNTYVEKKKTPRKKKKFGKRELLMIGIPVLAALAAVVVASFFVEKASRKTTSGTGHQYYIGVEGQVDGGSAIKKGDDGATYVEKDGALVEIPDLPVYYDGRDAFMVTEDMVWYEPRKDTYFKCDHFTELSVEDGTVHARFGGADKTVYKGFLFNGKQMFIFLEPVTVKTDRYERELPALSYAEADPNNNLVLFNYETKETEVFDVDVNATADASVYAIELFTHALIHSDGSRELLFTNPKVMDSMFLTEE